MNNFRNWIASARITPFLLASTIFLAWLLQLLRHILRMTGGRLVYGLDDPYIHLSIVQTVIEHGVYGVTPYATDFANSSVIWPLLLIVIGLFAGVSVWLPLVINVLCTILCLWLINRFGTSLDFTGTARFMVMLLFLVLTPVMTLVLNGMEHVLHILSLLWISYAFLRMGTGDSWKDRSHWVLLLSIAVSVFIRYETLFHVGGLVIVLLLDRRPASAILVFAAGVLPVFVAGVTMLAMGGYFVSYSLMVKGPVLLWNQLLDPANSLFHLILKPLYYGFRWRLWLMIAMGLGFSLLPVNDAISWRLRQLLQANTLALLVSLIYIGVGPLYRYEGYLIGSTVVLCSLAALRALQRHSRQGGVIQIGRYIIPAVVFLLLVFFPLVREGMRGINLSIIGSWNIYEQQYQMGRFLSRHYAGMPVALNDIGLTVLNGKVRPVDLVGLSEKVVAKARRDKLFTTDSIRAVVQRNGASIALLYDSWFEDEMELPSEWVKVEDWIIRDNIVCGDSIVSFYAIDKQAVRTLRSQLRAFRTLLPERVRVVEMPISPSLNETSRGERDENK